MHVHNRSVKHGPIKVYNVKISISTVSTMHMFSNVTCIVPRIVQSQSTQHIYSRADDQH